MRYLLSRLRGRSALGVALAIVLSSIFALSFTLLHPAASYAKQVKGAVYTTVDEAVDGTGHCQNGNPDVNCNIYDGKQYVWLNGGPTAGQIGDGTYFFAVLDPSGQADPNDGSASNLSSPNDAYTNRTFTISGGTVSYSGTHDFDQANNKIRLMPYNDTSNPGGVYIMAICSLADGYPVNPSDCKYDAFKVQAGGQVQPGLPLTITKDANGAYKNTFTWTITKAVDKTLVEQIGGSATFNYTVTVTRDGGTISAVQVTGTIQVFNPNVDSSNATVPVTIDGVTDQLSDGTNCTVTNGGSQTLTSAQTDFAYTCALSALPQGQLDNTATVNWSQQVLNNGALLDAGPANFTFSNISFAETKVDDCVNVTDPNSPNPPLPTTTCASTTYNYSKTVSVPTFNCVFYNNTATFTTNTTGTTGQASLTVEVCGPAKTGALTMGFWQNKNGQGIITGGSSTGGVCNSGTWLRQYAPFQDLSATATCSQVATYVYNVIKAATCGGSTCNAMLKAQMLATALDVYFSNPALGGNKINAPAPIGGVTIDLTKICQMIDGSGGTATCSSTFEDASSAFGGPSRTVLQMLSDAASQSNSGGSTWYKQVKATQVLAKDAFDAINNQVAFAP